MAFGSWNCRYIYDKYGLDIGEMDYIAIFDHDCHMLWTENRDVRTIASFTLKKRYFQKIDMENKWGSTEQTNVRTFLDIGSFEVNNYS